MASPHDTPTSSAPIPHFFKIILDDTAKNIRIKIPMKFVMKYGEHLSSPVHLKLPNGAEWEIELRRCNNGGVWFDKGWPEFSKFCSLDYGNWLVFGYEGNSNFHVLIFDRTSTEVEYAITKPEMEETDYEEEDDNSVEILDGFPPCPRKAREKSPLPCPQPHKKMRTCGKAECNMNFRPTKTQTSLRNKASDCSRSEMKKEDESDDDSVETLDKFPLAPSEVKDRVGRMHASTTCGKSIAFQRAIAFESVSPSFTVVMRPSYIPYGPLTVPIRFARSFVKLRKQTVTLQVRERSWPVNLIGWNKESSAKLSGGWPAFATENCLRGGDVCTFELIERNDIVLKVHIFRN
ncbi:B3 domain-containing transcription factor VRN1-like [Prunus dulcis]|uniref:B3 domain-containing transcription factor VRN1-like n=1 Tax=Prunus dulcis TaxID=3755 RepID=UPI0014826935|nr:B3 domain-containing transcription factor VRN1-like [Prunus dulcis]